MLLVCHPGGDPDLLPPGEETPLPNTTYMDALAWVRPLGKLTVFARPYAFIGLDILERAHTVGLRGWD
ncbi:hypothetical protein EES41_35005 [Streptomyces sp. ADI95-16]|nr:hypothetical protein EES41_35005 [Streptomyces sp. ADI95-16]